jgi:hypothetical protein
VPSNDYDVPNAIYVKVKDLNVARAHHLAAEATKFARKSAPKATGAMAHRMTPWWGHGFFGIKFQDNYAWFQEHGIKPFTMNSLQGKTIPMWIKDPTGIERQKNPKAKTRISKSGITEVLIFRKVALKGTRKMVKTKGGGWKNVPASYPGAPGRIAYRQAASPFTTPGKVGGQIAPPHNVGVRWRHPGLTGRHFMMNGLRRAAAEQGVIIRSAISHYPDGTEKRVFF